MIDAKTLHDNFEKKFREDIKFYREQGQQLVDSDKLAEQSKFVHEVIDKIVLSLNAEKFERVYLFTMPFITKKVEFDGQIHDMITSTRSMGLLSLECPAHRIVKEIRQDVKMNPRKTLLFGIYNISFGPTYVIDGWHLDFRFQMRYAKKIV